MVATEGTDKVSSSEHAELARPVSQEVDSYGIVPSGAAVPEVSTSAGTSGRSPLLEPSAMDRERCLWVEPTVRRRVLDSGMFDILDDLNATRQWFYGEAA